MDRRVPHEQEAGNVQILQTFLHSSSPSDPVLVAIDFEGGPSIERHFQRCGNQNSQVGLAILDTRCLSPESEVTTFNFITGTSAYFEKSACEFKCRVAEKNPISSILSKINDSLGVYQNRNILLVVHGGSSDLSALRALGFDFQEHQVTALLDTFEIGKELELKSLSLGHTLYKLINCPSEIILHNAANDAIQTLRALILLGVKATAVAEGNQTSERVELFKQIALKMVTTTMAKTMEMKETMRMMRTKNTSKKKKQRKTLEEQEEIRAKRREQRELCDEYFLADSSVITAASAFMNGMSSICM